MIELSFGQIAEICGGTLVNGDADTLVSGAVTTDSREITPGGIFVARPGEDTDGHLFVAAAQKNGAVLALVEERQREAIAQLVVPDATLALGQLAAAVVERVRARGRLKVIGITGSNGKTTTKNLLWSILEQIGKTVAPRRSYNNRVGAPTTMLEIDYDTNYLIVEMGASHPGDIEYLAKLAKPDVGIVLMVGLAHVGGFGGVEETARTKAALVAALAEDGVAVLNGQDSRVAQMAQLTAAAKIWFGSADRFDVSARTLASGRWGTRFFLTLPPEDAEDERATEILLPILGDYHVNNALAAAAAAFALGATREEIAAGLRHPTHLDRWRMQVLGGRDDITIINDAYNASPDSMAAALRTLAQLAEPGKRTVAVLGRMNELGDFSGEEHDRIGLLVVRLGIDQLVVVGPEARRLHISAINEGSWDGESVHVESQDAALEWLQGFLTTGDTVLVKSSNSAGLRFLGDRLGELYS